MANLEAAITNLLGRIDALNTRLDGVESKLSGAGSSSSAAPSATPAAAAGPSAAFIDSWDELVAANYAPVQAVVAKIGKPELKDQFKLVDEGMGVIRSVLSTAAASKKPAPDALSKLLTPLNEICGKVIAIRDSNRPSTQFNHLSAISEGIGYIGWVGVEPTPAPYVNEMKASAQFYTNKLLVAHKNKTDEESVDNLAFAKGLIQFFNELSAYIKKHHTTGLTWNPKGGEASSAPAAAAPPPPPAALPPPTSSSSSPAGSGGDMTSVFAALNKGTDISSGLRKVQAHEKTKNRPKEERSSIVPAVAKKTETKKPASTSKPKKPARGPVLEGNKWVVEYHDGNKALKIEGVEPRHTVYLYQCSNSVLQVVGKINAITMDSCSRTGMVIDNAVSVAEMVNCRSADFQVTGKVPAIQVDKCSGVNIILSAQCQGTEIVSSKSDAMNVSVPKDDDLVEIPIPEQFRSIVEGSTVKTGIFEHTG